MWSLDHSEVTRDLLVDFVGVPVVVQHDLALQGCPTGTTDPPRQRDDLGDRMPGAADDHLFTALDPFDDPRELRLRLVNIELTCRIVDHGHLHLARLAKSSSSTKPSPPATPAGS